MSKLLIPRQGYTLRQQQEIVDALARMAAFNDTGANQHLKLTGSYGLFDEPACVARARDLLRNTLRFKPEDFE